jgi:hypothetical protein
MRICDRLRAGSRLIDGLRAGSRPRCVPAAAGVPGRLRLRSVVTQPATRNALARRAAPVTRAQRARNPERLRSAPATLQSEMLP